MKLILSIDGGGIRGIVPGLILDYIEQQTGQPIAESFDIISGTSTGGIIALGLQAKKNDGALYSAKEITEIYTKHGEDIFKRNWFMKTIGQMGLTNCKYKHHALEKKLTEYFHDQRLSDIDNPTLVTSYNMTYGQPLFFKSHKAKQDPDRDYYLRDVARSTSAAPTYFKPHPIVIKGEDDNKKLCKTIDGGVYVNNPAMCGYIEAIKFARERNSNEEIYLVSLGTGEVGKLLDADGSGGWGLIKWLVPLFDIMFDGASDSVNYHLEKLLNPVEGSPKHYFRIQPELDRKGMKNMDNTDPENIANLVDFAQRTINDKKPLLDEICQLIQQKG